jgi:hypothetical protein
MFMLSWTLGHIITSQRYRVLSSRFICILRHVWWLTNKRQLAAAAAPHTVPLAGRVHVRRLLRRPPGHGVRVLLPLEEGPRLQAPRRPLRRRTVVPCCRDDAAVLSLRSRGRRRRPARVRSVPRPGDGRGDGAAAAGVQAPVPPRVHRPLAGGAPDVPGVPVAA